MHDDFDDDPEKDTSKEEAASEDPSGDSDPAPVVLLDMDEEPPAYVPVACGARLCLHNTQGWCTRQGGPVIRFNGLRGDSTDSTECETFQIMGPLPAPR